jgi:hypothetical protein
LNQFNISKCISFKKTININSNQPSKTVDPYGRVCTDPRAMILRLKQTFNTTNILTVGVRFFEDFTYGFYKNA